MEMEVWKHIPLYEGYEASTLGRVRSVDRIIIDSCGIPCNRKGRVLIPNIRNGYRQVHLPNNTMVKISILVMMAFKGYKNNDPNLVVDHKNNIKTNDKLDNLQIITFRKNISKDARNKTGFTGVSKNGNRYASYIRIKGTVTYLGRFNTPEEASNAYQTKLKELEFIN